MPIILIWSQPLAPGDGGPPAALATALAGRGAGVVLGWGGKAPPAVPAAVRTIFLPAAWWTAPPLVLDGAGRPVGPAWKKRRAAATLALFAGLDPALLILDRFPCSRRAFRFELRPLLEIARRRPGPPLRLGWCPPGCGDGEEPEPQAALAAEMAPLLDGTVAEPDPHRLADQLLLRLTGR